MYLYFIATCDIFFDNGNPLVYEKGDLIEINTTKRTSSFDGFRSNRFASYKNNRKAYFYTSNIILTSEFIKILLDNKSFIFISQSKYRNPI